MSRDSTECAAAETTAMQVYGVPYHLIRRDSLTFVSRMRQTCERQVESRIDFTLRHCRKHGVDFYCKFVRSLPQRRSSVKPIALLLDVLEVGCLVHLSRIHSSNDARMMLFSSEAGMSFIEARITLWGKSRISSIFWPASSRRASSGTICSPMP